MAPQFEGIPLAEKLWLVRKLLGERTKQGLFGRLFLNVQNLDDTVVMRTAEGTIVTIVDAYYLLRKRGASLAAALAAIESNRTVLARGTMPSSADLDDYVKYRVQLEHTHERQMTDFEIFRATSVTSEFIEKFFDAGPLQEDAQETDIKTANVHFMS